MSSKEVLYAGARRYRRAVLAGLVVIAIVLWITGSAAVLGWAGVTV